MEFHSLRTVAVVVVAVGKGRVGRCHRTDAAVFDAQQAVGLIVGVGHAAILQRVVRVGNGAQQAVGPPGVGRRPRRGDHRLQPVALVVGVGRGHVVGVDDGGAVALHVVVVADGARATVVVGACGRLHPIQRIVGVRRDLRHRLAVEQLALGHRERVAVGVVGVGHRKLLEVEIGLGRVAVALGEQTIQVIVGHVHALGLGVDEQRLVAVAVVARLPVERCGFVAARGRVEVAALRIAAAHSAVAQVARLGVLVGAHQPVETVVFEGDEVVLGVLLGDLVAVGVVEEAGDAHGDRAVLVTPGFVHGQ